MTRCRPWRPESWNLIQRDDMIDLFRIMHLSLMIHA